MANETAFTRTDPVLLPLLEELKQREPIFHNQAFGRTAADFELATAPDFWEVGASGRRYSREFILGMLAKEKLIDGDAAGWKASGFGMRRLGSDFYLLTYTLDQNGRITRRATIWEKFDRGWRILYHQGTLVSVEQDDTLP
jgi:hypothetical protein